jgi:competence protein ComEC
VSRAIAARPWVNAPAWSAPARWLAATLEAERARWPLWLPVALGVGIAVYFALPVEPPRATGAVLAAVVLLMLLVARRAAWISALLAALVAAAAGFVVAQERAHAVAAPVLTERLGPLAVQGRVAAVEARGQGWRVTLESPTIRGLAPDQTPARVRVTWRGADPPPAPGTWQATRAVLAPPPRPAAPGGYGFPRRAWFERLGGVGYAVAPWQALDLQPDPSWWQRLGALQTEARLAMAARFRDGLSGTAGALGAALATGDRGAVPEAVQDAFRASGLAHLLAISGLHMSMLAGLVFVGARGLLALFPALAARHDLKKPAALLALAATALYLMLSGANVPAQRAFLMTGVVLLAVLLNRAAITPRLVAWAALAVMLWQPHALLGPSFQMSFAAVLALVATYEIAAPRLSAWRAAAGPGRLSRPARVAALYVGGVLLTSLVAGLATMPYAAFHFDRVAVYGLAANLLAVPVMGLWVMPWLLAALMLAPLGGEALALVPLGWGLDALAGVATWVAGWPGASRLVPAMPAWGLAALSLGGLWLCLWRRPWRLAGVVGIAAGLVSPWSQPLPDLLVNEDGALQAVRGADGGLILPPGRADGFARALWQERFGGLSAHPWPAPGFATPDRTLRCDPRGCLYTAGGHVVALVAHRAALAEDCAAADVVITPLPAPDSCRAAGARVLDRGRLRTGGSHALWLAQGEPVRLRSAVEGMGDRLWTRAGIPDD